MAYSVYHRKVGNTTLPGTAAADKMLPPIAGVKGTLDHFAIAAGGVDHPAAGDNDAHMAYLGEGVVVEEYQVAFFQVVHILDLLPVVYLGVAGSGEAAAVAARLLEAI